MMQAFLKQHRWVILAAGAAIQVHVSYTHLDVYKRQVERQAPYRSAWPRVSGCSAIQSVSGLPHTVAALNAAIWLSPCSPSS